ncbi:hypothetical protein SAMN05421857_3209 [Chryseobacterium formosense]|nr:hypothetical protein SAMN05421857_3209 [Chryseobacterium formosense]
MSRVIIISLIIISCSKSNLSNNMKIYQKTKEFNELQDSVRISFSDAEKKFLTYHEKNKFNSLEPVFYYYFEDYYYFGYKTDAAKDKQNKSFFF